MSAGAFLSPYAWELLRLADGRVIGGTKTTDATYAAIFASAPGDWRSALPVLEEERLARLPHAAVAPRESETWEEYRARVPNPPDVFQRQDHWPAKAPAIWKSMALGFSDGSILYGWIVDWERAIPLPSGAPNGRFWFSRKVP